MRRLRITILALAAAMVCLSLSGCGTIVDEEILNTQANYSVEIINMPYATATPLPEHMNVPEPIVIDSDGNVTLNDNSVIEGDFQSLRDQEEQTEYRSLSLGSTGIAVQALQVRLAELGYFTGDVSGVFDIETENAVKRFEQTYGTMQTGVATAKLQLKLFAASAIAYGTQQYEEAVVSQYTILRTGMVGSSVYALQQRLKSLNYPIGDLSGVFDTRTARCVQLFYAAYGLAASDVASVAMQRELYSDTARVYNPSVQVTVTQEPQPDAAISLPDESEDIDESTAIALGNSGQKVSRIQQRLIALGYMPAGQDTGVFDQATQEAVNRFLTAIGRTPNGMLSLDMQDFLLSDRAPAYGGESQAASYQDLNVGDSGEAVMNLQRRLVELGYANGTPNGEYGQATISAVAFYQQCNGIEPDGIATAWLQSVLFSSQALTYEQTQSAPQAGPAEPASDGEAALEDETDTLYFSLGPGSTGTAVTTLQNRLVALGYLGSASTVYDEETRSAVTRFQHAIGVPEDGEASASLQRYLYSEAAPDSTITFYGSTQNLISLSLGMTGDEVTSLQRKLWDLGYLSTEGVQDSVGTFNEATRQAVIDAQRAMGYSSPDGVAGVEFQSFLYSRYGDYLKK